MKCYYLDASALVKQYVDEIGSKWLREVVDRAQNPLLFTSRMTIIEVVSAFARRVREDSLTLADFATARDAFRSDCLNEYQIMPPDIAIVDLACQLLERHPLRAYDATHLATALSAQEFLAKKDYPDLTFLSADERLNDAAKAEDLTVDNPNHH
jgi:hypothetical protein